jgi:hypothetical protein
MATAAFFVGAICLSRALADWCLTTRLPPGKECYLLPIEVLMGYHGVAILGNLDDIQGF